MNMGTGEVVAPIGHNSAAYGQMIKPAIPAAKKPPKGRFHYFKFYPRDWIEATRDMSLEARGAYIDLICIIMEMEGHLADNDSWISHQMHVSTRKWKSVKQQLVEHEKVRIEDGKIINERCLKELDTLLAQRRNISGSALVRERTKRDSIVSQPRTDDEKSENPNENNDRRTTVVPLRARVLDLDSDLEKEEERKRHQPASAEQAADAGLAGLRERSPGKAVAALASALAAVVIPTAIAAHPVEQVMPAPPGEAAGTNAATEMIVAKVAKWINQWQPDYMTARNWLTSTLTMFGEPAVRAAFAEMETKMASGDIVGRPLKLFTKICQAKQSDQTQGGSAAKYDKIYGGVL